jgi:hypothetical protein
MTLIQYLKKQYCKETLDLLQLAPCGVRAYVDKIPSAKRDQCRRDMEGIAYFAAAYAAYLDERHGGGCGDQGHKDADKAALKAARSIWTKIFGYNAHNDGPHFIPE